MGVACGCVSKIVDYNLLCVFAFTLVQLNLAAASVPESVCTLQFGERVGRVCLGKTKKVAAIELAARQRAAEWAATANAAGGKAAL